MNEQGTSTGVTGLEYLKTKSEGDCILEKFHFHGGNVLDQLKIHFVTFGDPAGDPVLVLHGTCGSGAGMLTDGFAGQLFRPGQVLDARRHFVILPDAIGTGGSAKPSDGLVTKFPPYNYDDMVEAQYRLTTEHFGLTRLRLIIGNSMGGMHTWLWGIRHPGFADALVPMACQPGPMSGRNWMMRRMVIDSIRNDPAWSGGYYSAQPPNLRTAMAWFVIATSGGSQRLQQLAPARSQADAYVDARLAEQYLATSDANDTLYQWEASADYDPSNSLREIQVPVLAVNSADDERNPPELGVMGRLMPLVCRGETLIVPASPDTRGHATTGTQAHLYAGRLAKFLEQIPLHGDSKSALSSKEN